MSEEQQVGYSVYSLVPRLSLLHAIIICMTFDPRAEKRPGQNMREGLVDFGT